VVGAAALFVVMGGGFTAKVIAEGRRASVAMKRLSTSAPVFAARAEELLRNGDFEGALEVADNAVDLDASVAEHHVIRPNALGFYDLGGNAWEWMADQLPRDRGFVRGGGFSTRTSRDAEVSQQIDNQHPSDGGRIAGFRLALEVAH
jgi:formylglycine-generating enzyme required for sulfatase activity